MNTLNLDVNKELLFHLNINDLKSICSSSYQFNKICHDKNFWIQKLKYEKIPLLKPLPNSINEYENYIYFINYTKSLLNNNKISFIKIYFIPNKLFIHLMYNFFKIKISNDIDYSLIIINTKNYELYFKYVLLNESSDLLHQYEIKLNYHEIFKFLYYFIINHYHITYK